MKQLTKVMCKALDKMRDGKWYSAYGLQISLNTMNALQSRGLVESKCGLGSVYCPATGIKFKKVKNND